MVPPCGRGPAPGVRRAHHQIPACPVRATSDDGEMVTIAKAAAELDVSTATVHRWLREGFIVGEQITPGAPWQIRLTDELRARVCEQAPDGWLPLAQAAKALGVARQTVLHKVQRGDSPPSTSTAASEKAYESRSNPTRLDCSRTTSERRRSAKPTPPV